MRHCSNAVHNTDRNAKNKSHITNGIVYRTRVVSSNTCVNGESDNWKYDLHRFKRITCAQVIQNKSKHLPVQNCQVKPKIDSSCHSRNTNELYSDTNTKNACKKSTTEMKSWVQMNRGKKVGVKPKTFQIACSNKFDVLYPGDGVTLPQSSPNTSNADNDQYLVDQPKTKDDNNSPKVSDLNKASFNDACESFQKSNPSQAKQSKPMQSSVDADLEVQNSTKYDLSLRFKDKKLDYEKIMASSPTFKLWDKQNESKFGFIPMGELDLPENLNPSDIRADPLTLHHIIKASGDHNYKHCQIPIKSQLNPEAWEELLQGYWDIQLPLLIRYGFPLDFYRDTLLESHFENHTSAKNYPEDVRTYLQEEISYKAILGPFEEPPLEHIHIYPFMTRDKPNSKNRRVIIDLSFPQGKSVNAGSVKDSYLNTPFVLKLPTIDHITNRVKLLGRGCMIYKIDIKRAFRHVKLDPKENDLLGLRQDHWFLDTCQPFGFRHGSALFQCLSDAVRHMMRQRGYDITNYIDDILGIELPSRVDASFDALGHLLSHLGFEISQNKLVKPSTCVNCLGILVDTKNFTLSIPPQKMQEILDMCQTWRQKTHCTKRQHQSLLGSLLFVSKCVHTSRFFLNRLLEVLRQMHDKNQVPLTTEAQRDINWFVKFVPTFNGVTIFDHRPISFDIELDACLQGIGARCGIQVYTLPLPLGYLNFNIAHLEMLNILVALRVWNHCWKTKKKFELHVIMKQ